MKYCNKCKVDVQGHLTYCPLCQNELQQKDDRLEEELFPDTYNIYTSRHMFLKILGFISISAAMISLVINLLLPARLYWSLIVIAVIACIWLSVATAISKHRNILKYLLYQSLIICLFAGFIDYLTGGYGWSIDLVLPIVFTLAMIVMYLLTKILHLQAGDYIIYLLLDAIFGIVPILFILLKWVNIRIPSIICIMASIISLTALIIFEGRSIFEELNRRLHI